MALVRTFAARGVASVGSVVLVIVLGQLYGVVGVGVFALAQSLVTGVAVFARWGMDGALTRFVGRDLKSPVIASHLRHACARTIVMSSIGAVAVYILRGEVAVWFHSPALTGVTIGIAISIPAYVLCFIFSGFMAAARKPAVACLLQNGAIALATAVTLFPVQFVFGQYGLAGIGAAYAVAAWIICLWGAWMTLRWLRVRGVDREPRLATEIIAFRRSASAFFANDIATFLVAVAGIWVAGLVLPTSVVGQFKAAWQVSMLIGIVLTVINFILPARFSSLFHHGDMHGLARLARHGVLLALVLGALPLLLCMLAPTFVLRLMGHGFGDAALALQVLAVGQLFNIGCGSVGHLLNMTGHEALVRNIAWVANLTGLLILATGALLFGIAGVAVGVTLSVALRKLFGVYYVWRCLGIWILPLPNLLAAAGVTVKGTGLTMLEVSSQ